MNHQEAANFTRRWTDAVVSGDERAWETLLSADVRDLSSGTAQVGSATFRERTRAVRSAFDQVTVRVEDLLVDGDRIAWRWRFEGVHTGRNQRISFCGVNLQTIKEGRVVEHWTLADVAGALSRP